MPGGVEAAVPGLPGRIGPDFGGPRGLRLGRTGHPDHIDHVDADHVDHFDDLDHHLHDVDDLDHHDAAADHAPDTINKNSQQSRK